MLAAASGQRMLGGSGIRSCVAVPSSLCGLPGRPFRSSKPRHLLKVLFKDAEAAAAGGRATPLSPLPRAADVSQLEQQYAAEDAYKRSKQTDELRSPVDIWQRNAEAYGDAPAAIDPHVGRTPLTTSHRELYANMLDAAAGLAALDLGRGDGVCLFGEGSSRWLTADQAVMMNGAFDAVRGSTAPAEELLYILHHSGAVGLIVQETATLAPLLPALRCQAGLKFIVTLWGDDAAAAAAEQAGQLPCPVLSFDQLLAAGRAARGASSFAPVPLGANDVATLVYTSGTTGHPKAVSLTHANLAYQINRLDSFLPVRPGERTLSLLPPWHIYERSAAYYVASRGAAAVHSNVRRFRDDLGTYPPDYLVCVPLVLDTLYSRVMAKLKSAGGTKAAVALGLLAASVAFVRARRVVAGVALQWAVKPRTAAALAAAALAAALLAPLHALAQRLVASQVRAALGVRRTIVSGGGSLAAHLDDFFEAVGIEVLNGWGLSETSPVLACRRNAPGKNVRGSIGYPMPGTRLRVVDPADTSKDLPDGQQGLLLARGPGIMAGYHGDAAATAKAFTPDGWFITGDLGWRAPAGVAGSEMAGCIVLSGRTRDTLVLSSGKNVEPQPLEDALQGSALIKHALLLGSDKRELGALVFPDLDALEALGAESPGGVPPSGAALQALIEAEVARLNAARLDYQPYEHIAHCRLVLQRLSPDDGTLTRTMKPRRDAIVAKYDKDVVTLMKQLRG